MQETQKNVTFTIPTKDAKHMVTVLTKLETASTLKHVNAQFVTNATGTVTLCAEAYATAHGFGITQLTQHYPNSIGDMTNIVTFVLAASDLKKRLRERTQTADKGESISITLEVAPNTTVNSVCESPVKPPVEYEHTFTIGQKELNTLQARHTYTRFKDTGFEMMNIVYTPSSTTGHVYSTNRYVTTQQGVQLVESATLNTKSKSGKKGARSRSTKPATVDVFLDVTYDTVAVYNAAAGKSGNSVVKHDTDGSFTITHGNTTLFQTVMGTTSKVVSVKKYFVDLHSKNVAGQLRDTDNLTPMARVKRKKLVDTLKNLVKETGGHGNSLRLTVLIRNTDDAADTGVELLLRNWDNHHSTTGTIPSVQDGGTARWEPTVRSTPGESNTEEVEERERRLVTYNVRSMLHGLATCRGEWVSVMPPKYFTDDLIVYVHDDPDNAGDKGSWFMIPLSKTETYLHPQNKK
jgi:hypothetical protein